MATNLRYMFYKKRVNNKWKGEYSEKVQGSVSNLLYNDYSVPNVRRANPIRHWRRQGSSLTIILPEKRSSFIRSRSISLTGMI